MDRLGRTIFKVFEVVTLELESKNRPKSLAWKRSHLKNTSKIFHSVIFLKIPFYSHQPTFGRNEFFFPFPKYWTLNFLNGITPKKTKLHQMCYCDVQTFQTKSTMYKQCQQSSQDSAKKSSGYWAGPPQRFQEIDAPAPKSEKCSKTLISLQVYDFWYIFLFFFHQISHYWMP